MRLVLMGTGPFAVPSFERIRETHEILAVIYRPEKSQSHVKKGPPPSPVRLWAEQHGLPVFAPSTMNSSESIAWLHSMPADLMVVCDYGQILSSECLGATRLGGINLHGSLLPRHRGAAPVQWSILTGDVEAGVSVIHMTPGLDAGPILARASTRIGSDENAWELERRLSELGKEPTLRSIELLSSLKPGDPPLGSPQDKSRATKAPRLAKADGLLDPRYAVRYLDRQIRGLQPWPGTYMNVHFASGTELRMIVSRSTSIVCTIANLAPDVLGSWEIGTLVYGKKAQSLAHSLSLQDPIHLGILVPDGILNLHTVQPAGKREMSAEEFVRGYARQEWMRIGFSNEPHPLLESMIRMESQNEAAR